MMNQRQSQLVANLIDTIIYPYVDGISKYTLQLGIVGWMLDNGLRFSKAGYFPILIQLEEGKEMVCNIPQDIPQSVTFKVVKTNYHE